MNENLRKSFFIGSFIGGIFGLIVMLIAWLSQDVNDTLQFAINFSGSVSFYIASLLNMPEFLGRILFLIYWAFVGGILGALITRESLVARIIALTIMIGLFILHWQLQMIVENEFQVAMEAFGKGISQVINDWKVAG